MWVTRQTKIIRHNERGFASMVVALILVLVLALLTIGFAQVARREQQNALAKQLATQANYAAESAINDASVDIKKGLITTANSGGGTTCINPSALPAAALSRNPDIEPAYGVSYSCLLVSLQPPSLIKQPLEADKGWTVAFNTSASLASLNIRWKTHSPTAKTSQGAYAGSGFTPSGSWGNHPAVLQFSLTPLALGTDRASMINNTFTAYLYPSAGANSINYAASTSTNNARVVPGGCNAAATNCNVTVTGITGLTGTYLLHIFGYYDASDITVTGTSTAGSALSFVGGQAQIDATGKAKNVLKRLQARVSLSGADLPDFALEAQNVCKRFTTMPFTTTYDTLDPSCTLGPP